ncbi:Rieske 2Fe-2S domain-containing protein [Sinorhizobium meliloti]|uniref:Rieske 2Fe-2S domain-containing protein n=1 Tax=Rhizobium meliloti TaxID=382 RepID=UPI00398CDF7C
MLRPGEVDSVDKLQPGQGCHRPRGLDQGCRLARAEDGTLYKRSESCTHIGCHVHWNSLERCWDCPCHGSHFAVDGTALNGPAVSPLTSDSYEH